ncbi:hypothetical protein [Methylomonas rhizoryzae]|uniref:hypothetical protein n=1 Tax=Methylomonas rhizoryzae TaxID=2608981 RepID=UPI001232EDD2|nr:hypothetical protein [Methylomonas rhizoryzae]
MDWTREEIELTEEFIRNQPKQVELRPEPLDPTDDEIMDGSVSGFIDWDAWKKWKDITPEEAAHLAFLIDFRLRQGDFSNKPRFQIEGELKDKISKMTRDLKNVSEAWTLSGLAHYLGDDTPIRMMQAVADDNETLSRSTGVYAERDKDFIAWINDAKPILNEMTKKEIHKALINRNRTLWIHGFADWWKYQKFHEGKPGRRKRNLI